VTIDREELVFADVHKWRKWLESHHSSSPGIWLILAKKGTLKPTSLTYTEALEEALCFGWIDGQAHSRDAATLQAGLHPATEAKPVVEAQHGHRRAAGQGGKDARVGRGRDGSSQG